MHIKTLALAAAMSLSALSASAATLYAGEINKTQQTFVEAGDFTDVYLFKLDFPPPADVGFSFIEMKFKQYTDIAFPTDAIKFGYGFDGDQVTDVFLSLTPTVAPGGVADQTSAEFVVDKKLFYMSVAGTTVGTGLQNKGSYSFEIVAAPVPEPQTYALAVSGLALVGWVASRRRRTERV